MRGGGNLSKARFKHLLFLKGLVDIKLALFRKEIEL